MNWKRSTACASASCVEVASSYCSNGACVLVSHQEGRILVRDSKLGEESPVLEYSTADWSALLAEVLAGEWDGGAQMSWSRDGLTYLHFSGREIDAFAEGAKAGEFAVEVLTR